jgi:tetratricopeptide (TPR) repeat protein
LSANSQYDEALVEIRKARSLDPLSVRIVVNEGEILFFAGQFDQAREQLQLALDMNPNFPMTHWFLGRSLYYARQYDAAVSHLRKAVELSPDTAGSHRLLGIVYETLWKYREAIGEFERMDVLNGMSPAEASARAAALRKALAISGEKGYWRESIALTTKAREKSPHAYAFTIAYNYAHLGDNAKAVAWLETCLQEKTCPLTLVRADPGLDRLRSDPHYQSLLRRISLSQ